MWTEPLRPVWLKVFSIKCADSLNHFFILRTFVLAPSCEWNPKNKDFNLCVLCKKPRMLCFLLSSCNKRCNLPTGIIKIWSHLSSHRITGCLWLFTVSVGTGNNTWQKREAQRKWAFMLVWYWTSDVFAKYHMIVTLFNLSSLFATFWCWYLNWLQQNVKQKYL